MAFADLLDPSAHARRDPRDYYDLIAGALKNQQAAGSVQATGLENQYNQGTMDSRIAGADARTLGEQLANQYNQATMDPRIAEAGSKANEAASIAREAGLKLPALEIAARQANLAGQRLSAMGVPGLDEAAQSQSPNLPPSMQQATQLQAGQDGSSQNLQAGGPPQGAAATPAGQAQAAPSSPAMPAIFSHYQGMDLNQLRQAKMEDDQGGGYMKQFIDPALNMKMTEAKQAMYNDLENGKDKNGMSWPERRSASGINVQKGAEAFDEFRNQHPIITLLPQAEQDKIQGESFKVQPQPNAASQMNQPAPKGGGLALAEQVQLGNMLPHDAVSSILNNRQLSPDGKQKELIEYSSALPTLGGKYSGPQLATFAKNAADPSNNRSATAINAVTPNIDALLKLSDQYGRLDIPMLNKAIESGGFNMGDQTITNMEQLQKIIAEEAGKVFGGAATSDFKIKLGDQMLDLSLGQKNFRSNAMQLKQAMINKKRAMSDAAGPYSIWKDDPDLKQAGGSNPNNAGKPKVGDTRKNAHGDNLIYGENGWGLAGG